MAVIPQVIDRTLETSTTTGTGTYTLGGAVTGYQSFAAVGDGNTCFYCAIDVDAHGVPQGGWEVGLGTYTASGTTLARTSVLASSNGGSAVSWSSGTRWVFLTAAADWLRRAGPILLDTQVASSSASLDFTTRINGEFSVYLFEIDSLVPATNAVSLYLRCSIDGGVTFDANSNYGTCQSKNTTTTVAGTGSDSASGIPLMTDADANISNDTTHQGLSGWMKAYTPQGASWKKFIGQSVMWTTGSVLQHYTLGGLWKNGGAINAIRFVFSSGNIASGTIRMYGIP